MSIWPFNLGRFIELQYALVQDYIPLNILREDTPRSWLKKIEFIERYGGMAPANTHPAYLLDRLGWKIYTEFLGEMKRRDGYWHALPMSAALAACTFESNR